MDIKDFFLNTTMKRSEYIRLKTSSLPKHLIKKYKLAAKTTKNGYAYIQICKGMYGPPQYGIPEQKLLEQRLNEKGYRLSSLTPDYWRQNWRPISFTLFFDYFGVNYVREEHTKYLVTSISKKKSSRNIGKGKYTWE